MTDKQKSRAILKPLKPYDRYRLRGQTTTWITKRDAAFLDRHKLDRRESRSDVLERLFSELRALRRRTR